MHNPSTHARGARHFDINININIKDMIVGTSFPSSTHIHEVQTRMITHKTHPFVGGREIGADDRVAVTGENQRHEIARRVQRVDARGEVLGRGDDESVKDSGKHGRKQKKET